MKVLAVAITLLFTIAITPAATADSVEEKISTIVSRLHQKGVDYAAFRLLSKLDGQPGIESTRLRQLKLRAASWLMCVEGIIGKQIDPLTQDDAVFTATHPVFPDRNQSIEHVKSKLIRAETMLTESLNQGNKIDLSFRRYYANQSLEVTTTLQDHLRIIEILRSPSLGNPAQPKDTAFP